MGRVSFTRSKPYPIKTFIAIVICASLRVPLHMYLQACPGIYHVDMDRRKQNVNHDSDQDARECGLLP